MQLAKFFSVKNSKFKFLNSYLTCFLIIIMTFSIDRISKVKIINHQINNDIIYINDFINFELVFQMPSSFERAISYTDLR